MPYIIAEIGVNHNGSLNLASQMIQEAKKAGANAVKFQYFLPEDYKDQPHIAKLALDIDKLKLLKIEAKHLGLDFIVTPFIRPKLVDQLEEKINPDKYKIREKDSNNEELIKRVLKTGKEVLISMQELPNEYLLLFNPRVKLLYCIPKYPPTITDLKNFEDKIEGFEGISNHYPSIYPCILALSRGLEIIEVHVTLNHEMDVIDKNVSLDFNELKQIVEYSKFLEVIRK